MQYPDGQQVRLGDSVQCWAGCTGVVVASMDTDEYPSEHSKAQWRYLKSGVMIQTDKAGLIHYTKPEPDMVLLGRSDAQL